MAAQPSEPLSIAVWGQNRYPESLTVIQWEGHAPFYILHRPFAKNTYHTLTVREYIYINTMGFSTN